MLNVAGDAALFFEEVIEVGARHPDEPAQGHWLQCRRAQVTAHRLAHALLATEIDLRFGDSRDRAAATRAFETHRHLNLLGTLLGSTYRFPDTSGVIVEHDEIVVFHSVAPRVCPFKRDACASRLCIHLETITLRS